MTTPDPTPLDALKGQPAYELAIRLFRNGDPLGALAVAHTAQRGAEALVQRSASLARQQGRSWAEIGHALNITRQSAQSRFGGAGDGSIAPFGVPEPAQLVADGTIDVGVGAAGPYRYPVKVFQLADGTRVAVLATAWGNPSMLDRAQPLMAEVQRQWPGAHVLECWPSDTLGTTVGAAGHYAWSGGNGGHIPADLADLAARGLELR